MMLSLSIIILIFMISVYAILYYVFLQLSEAYVLRERGRLMIMQNHYGKLLLEKQESSIDEMLHLRHDLRHHIRTALSMLEQGAADEAAAQFSNLLEKIDSVTLMNFCENRTANYVFSYFYEKAQKENIEISIQAAVADDCGIDAVDLGGILSNILENAVEGCQRVKDGTPRSIRFSCMHRDSKILISCENSCVSDILFKDDMPVTSKKSGGIGTQSISRAAAVYNGLAGFSAHNGTFCARVVLHAV